MTWSETNLQECLQQIEGDQCENNSMATVLVFIGQCDDGTWILSIQWERNAIVKALSEVGTLALV